MRRLHLARSAGAALLLAVAATRPLAAQDSLRVLRFAPDAPATPSAPVVIAFDHPVAPRLDESVDPESAITITPRASARIYWRDPSTIVAEFDELWAPGATYEVRLRPDLRSASGLPLARVSPMRVRVGRSRLLYLRPSLEHPDQGAMDPSSSLAAVYGGSLSVADIAGRAWFVPRAECARRDSVRLDVASIRPLRKGDDHYLLEAGGYDRDRRLDSLRRLVLLKPEAAIPRGCRGDLALPEQIGEAKVQRRDMAMLPPFRLLSIETRSLDDGVAACPGGTCQSGPLLLRFSNPVGAQALRAHLRIDGRAPAFVDNGTASDWWLEDSARVGRAVRITIDPELASRSGDRLAMVVDTSLRGIASTKGLGYATGPVIVPAWSRRLLRVRYGNSDSVEVVIARVRDSLRGHVLTHTGRSYGPVTWARVVSDSVVRTFGVRASATREGVLDVGRDQVPDAWRADPLLLVRAMPVKNPPRPSAPPSRRRSERGRVLPAIQVIGYAGSRDRLHPRFAVVQHTGLAAHALLQGSTVAVWVTRLASGAPVAGARVRLLDARLREVAAGTSDDDGVVQLRGASRGWAGAELSRPHIEVTHRKSRVLVAMPGDRESAADAAAHDPESADRQGDPALPIVTGSAFSDRRVYRPGERIYLKGLVWTFRQGEGYRTHATDSTRWTLSFAATTPERIGARSGRLGELGTDVDSIDLSPQARVGPYRIDLAIRDRHGWRTVATTRLDVVEYRVPEFAVRLRGDTTKPMYAGDTAAVAVDARYLFGPPMAGANVKGWISTSEHGSWRPALPALDGYSVGRPSWRSDDPIPSGAPAQPISAVTDGRGELTLAVPVPRLAAPARMHVAVEVEDANRQTIWSRLDLPIRAADAFVGIRTAREAWLWSTRDTIPLELLAVRGDGAVRHGAPILLTAIRSIWDAGRWRTDTIWRTTLTSGQKPVRARFRPPSGGSYALIASVRDDSGRLAESMIHLYVMGSARQPRRVWSGLAVRADRPTYMPGDTVHAIIEAPGTLTALVRLGQHGIAVKRVVQLRPGQNVVKVPLPATAAARMDLDVLAARGLDRRRGSADSATFLLRSGVHIEVDSTVRALTVRLTPDRPRYAPRDTVRLSLDVRDRMGRGRRGEAAVWAVDEGVVSLTGQQLPSVLLELLWGGDGSQWVASTLLASLLAGPPGLTSVYFREPLGHGVAGAMSSMSVAPLAPNLPPPPGALVGDGAGILRRDFRTTPFFAGSVVTDSSGGASTSFVLPDNATTFRLFAVAVGDDASAGSVDTTIVSSRTLIVRPALSRIVRTGDSLFAGAVITREGGGSTPVSLRVSATGMAVDGAATVHDTLEGGRARERRFPMRVVGSDSVVVELHATTAGEGDGARIRLPVSPAGRPRARVVMGTLQREAALQLDLPADIDLARSTATLQLGASPLPLVQHFTEVLRVYPYQCTEQVASAARALLARMRLQRTVGDTAPVSRRDRRQLELAVNLLLDRQRHDGGFGYWSARGWTSPWLTAYGLEMLMGAREAGISVSPLGITRARGYLDAVKAELWSGVARHRANADSARGTADALHIAQMLRRTGVADTVLEREIWARQQELGFEDRLLLASLRAAAGDSVRARALLAAAWGSARIEGRRVVLEDSAASRRWVFRSIAAPVTALLTTTVALQPNHPLLGALFESLVQDTRAESTRWNTIDQAAAAEALASASRQLGLADGRQVSVAGARGGRIALSSLSHGRSDSMTIPLEALLERRGGRSSLRMRLASPSAVPTYYALTLFEVPTGRPVRADDEGIAVERWYERFDDGRATTEVAEGELVRVRLRITVPRDREFVVIDDALPAGLEAVDQSLRTAGSPPPHAGALRLAGDLHEGPVGQRWLYGSWDGGWWTPWEHKEIRDDRVLYFARQLWRGSYQASYVARATTAGVFVRPPAQAEEMYNPAVRGRSDGGAFTVRSPGSGASRP